MSKIKLKGSIKPTILDEARTVGYMEGYSDGRNSVLGELIQFKLLKNGWKRIYNKRTLSNYYIK